MTYLDRSIPCVDCGISFVHSAADQEYYAEKGFTSDPKRCPSCRSSRRAARGDGYDARSIGGPRGYERGYRQAVKEQYWIIQNQQRTTAPSAAPDTQPKRP